MSRPFDANEIPEEVRSDMENVLRQAMEVRESDPTLYDTLLAEYFRLARAESLRQANLYPGDPPNASCNHAILKGVLVSNESGFKTHDFTPLFEIPNEAVSIWTHTKSTNSCLVSRVSDDVHHETVWISAGTLIHLAMGLTSFFEHVPDIDYDWIYNFNPQLAVTDCTFMDVDSYDRFSGTVKKVCDLANLAQLMELLIRDERFLVATQNLFASFANHWFCVICALSPMTHRKHPNDEQLIWQFADSIPRMEAAIVQATRSVEAILGKPGRRRDRVLDRWSAAIPLDPHEDFGFKPISLIDYYYELFGVRGDAAHSLGKLSLGMSRELTIEAQCFACKVHRSYCENNCLSTDAAMSALNFNRPLVEAEPDDWSTQITADDEYFDHFPRTTKP
jgi:hypothetical protein